MTRHVLVSVILMLLAFGAVAQPAGFQPPHILMIGIDTWRGDHLGCTGNDWIRTPHLDALAADGIVFSRCHSTAPWTLPSFASIFTGLLPNRHGAVGGAYQKLGDDHHTLTEYLDVMGYRTSGFVSINYLSQPFGMGQGFNQEAPPGLDGSLDRASRITWLSLEALRTQDLTLPTFLFLHYFDVHAPYEPPLPFSRMYYQGDELAPGSRVLDMVRSEQNRAANRDSEMYDWLGDVTDRDFPIKEYAAGVSYVDDHVGQLVAFLKAKDLYRDMLIIVVSDHGEHLGEHDLWFTHSEPWQECIHVPLIMKMPTNVFGGQTIDVPVSTIDIMPTVMNILSLEAPDVDGRSLLPLIAGQTAGHQTKMIAEQGASPDDYMKTLIDWPWKLMVVMKEGTSESRLYNLNADPGETIDLAQKHAAKTLQMERRLWRVINPESPIVENRVPIAADVDDATRKRLEALGY